MERPKMKLPVAVLAMLSTALLLCPSPGFAQQTGSSGASTNSSNRQTQAFEPFFPPPNATIRILGGPTVQPSRGSRLECTAVEQGMVGFIIGPTDLCDRWAARLVTHRPPATAD